MSTTMELSQETLETIGRYVKQNLSAWVQEVSPLPHRGPDPVLLERIVRVEEQLNTTNNLLKQGFKDLRSDMRAALTDQGAQFDRRFQEQTAHLDKRFEEQTAHFNQRFEDLTSAMDKRFEEQTAHFNQRFEDLTSAMDKRFEAVDRRFEDFNHRFDDFNHRLQEQREDMNARFDQTNRNMNRWMGAMTLVIALVGMAATLAVVFTG